MSDLGATARGMNANVDALSNTTMLGEQDHAPLHMSTEQIIRNAQLCVASTKQAVLTFDHHGRRVHHCGYILKPGNDFLWKNSPSTTVALDYGCQISQLEEGPITQDRGMQIVRLVTLPVHMHERIAHDKQQMANILGERWINSWQEYLHNLTNALCYDARSSNDSFQSYLRGVGARCSEAEKIFSMMQKNEPEAATCIPISEYVHNMTEQLRYLATQHEAAQDKIKRLESAQDPASPVVLLNAKIDELSRKLQQAQTTIAQLTVDASNNSQKAAAENLSLHVRISELQSELVETQSAANSESDRAKAATTRTANLQAQIEQQRTQLRELTNQNNDLVDKARASAYDAQTTADNLQSQLRNLQQQQLRDTNELTKNANEEISKLKQQLHEAAQKHHQNVHDLQIQHQQDLQSQQRSQALSPAPARTTQSQLTRGASANDDGGAFGGFLGISTNYENISSVRFLYATLCNEAEARSLVRELAPFLKPKTSFGSNDLFESETDAYRDRIWTIFVQYVEFMTTGQHRPCSTQQQWEVSQLCHIGTELMKLLQLSRHSKVSAKKFSTLEVARSGALPATVEQEESIWKRDAMEARMPQQAKSNGNKPSGKKPGNASAGQGANKAKRN